ncbi:helix-turn-helix domain-containing protein [Alkalihalobacterium alkalinitrilicum]|uniref:helix-turn-helix domain-containing protein n=1 Tax=Alkalihalobacterium alkalinitrilicum TaxID=427920 RepID=UPI001C565575|nr:helix-turn-helix transcriptional regulator [Alkalihalobacterium alkalinitrilicum]
MKKNPILYNALGEVIKLRRLHKGMKQKKLAEEANLDDTYISDIERGLRNPTFDVLFSIARALDTYSSVLCKEVEDKVIEDIDRMKKEE